MQLIQTMGMIEKPTRSVSEKRYLENLIMVVLYILFIPVRKHY